MASGKAKKIDEIEDMMEMLETMRALGISWKGLKTLEEMKARVRDVLHESQKKPSWTAGQVRKRLILSITNPYTVARS